MKVIRKIVVIIVLITLNPVFSQTALEIEKVTITVRDLKVSVPFFENILDFKKVRSYSLKGEAFQRLVGIDNKLLVVNIVELKLGNETIALQEFINENNDREIPLESKSNDLWFQHIAIVVSDMEKAYDILKKAGVTYVSTSPQTLPDYITAAAGIKAFYFQDPDKHNLEIIYFPKGKGDPKWQKPTGSIFIGIDHTAIGIDKTDPSTNFYENLLGLKTMGQSENYGSEQEHLNQLFGARLWISGLRAKQGIGLEFLDYIAPPGGKPYPSDSTPTDLWHWHTTIKVSDINATYKNLQEANRSFISNGVVTIDNKKQFMVRDSDGHAVLIVQ